MSDWDSWFEKKRAESVGVTKVKAARVTKVRGVTKPVTLRLNVTKSEKPVTNLPLVIEAVDRASETLAAVEKSAGDLAETWRETHAAVKELTDAFARKMGRPRKYASPAERQRAYRERRKQCQ